jgi:hypothetical protein
MIDAFSISLYTERLYLSLRNNATQWQMRPDAEGLRSYLLVPAPLYEASSHCVTRTPSGQEVAFSQHRGLRGTSAATVQRG